MKGTFSEKRVLFPNAQDRSSPIAYRPRSLLRDSCELPRPGTPVTRRNSTALLEGAPEGNGRYRPQGRAPRHRRRACGRLLGLPSRHRARTPSASASVSPAAAADWPDPPRPLLHLIGPGRHVIPRSRQAPNSNRETISPTSGGGGRKRPSCRLPPYLQPGRGRW